MVRVICIEMSGKGIIVMIAIDGYKMYTAIDVRVHRVTHLRASTPVNRVLAAQVPKEQSIGPR